MPMPYWIIIAFGALCGVVYLFAALLPVKRPPKHVD
jgi:hypothetical protein